MGKGTPDEDKLADWAKGMDETFSKDDAKAVIAAMLAGRFVLRPLIASFSLLDPAQIEVASSLGARPVRIVRQIIFPAALPALLAGGSLCLLLTVNEFGILLFIGAKGVITLPLLVYDKAIQQFDYASACVIASVNVLLSLMLYSLYRVALSGLGGERAAVV